MSWIGVGILDTMTPTPQSEAAAETFNGLVTVIYLVSGFGILGLLGALLKVKSRRWNVALLVILIACFFVSGVIEPYA
jgi:hypothetical protein